MADGYYCDDCGKPFKGKPVLEIGATLRGEFEDKKGQDSAFGQYCIGCAGLVYAKVPWDEEE